MPFQTTFLDRSHFHIPPHIHPVFHGDIHDNTHSLILSHIHLLHLRYTPADTWDKSSIQYHSILASYLMESHLLSSHLLESHVLASQAMAMTME
jgi:hypothetical protein